MDKKEPFGGQAAKDIDPGDLVKWTKWNPDLEDWDEIIGIVITISEEIRGNRMVSIAKVVSLNNPLTELDFFTMSLKLISKGFKKY
tara:strand:+ start:23482 stop:23739 length:258 start_codon:yes stop_codon:yes gene_type:complete